MAITGLIGRKLGMTTLYWEDGRVDGVTLLEVGPCFVTQIRTRARDGYEAVQVGFQDVRHLNKPAAGHLARSNGRFRHLQEFSVDDLGDYEVGQILKVSIFQQGDTVTVRGISKGRGFAGGVRRYGFKGGPKTHGQSDRHRAPGSIGAGSSPGRVWKGTRMAGHMGARRVTSQGLKVALVDDDRNILAVRGSIPGPKNGIVRIRVQGRGDGESPAVLFTPPPLDDLEPEKPVSQAPPDEASSDNERAGAVPAGDSGDDRLVDDGAGDEKVSSEAEADDGTEASS